MILNHLMLQSCQLCDVAHDFRYDPHIFEGNVSYVLDVHVLMLIYIYWLPVSLNVVLGRHKNGVKNCCVCFRTSTGTH